MGMFKSYMSANTDYIIDESCKLNEFEELQEAVFSEQNLNKVMKLYGKLFAKHFGSKFYLIGEEKFKKSQGSGVGARFINQQGYQLRFNWDKTDLTNMKTLDKQSKGKQLYLSSIDYWDPFNSDFAKPSLSVYLLKELNVVQIWDEVSKLIKRGVKGKYTLSDLIGKHSLDEAFASDVSSTQKTDFLKKMGFKTGAAVNTSKKDLDRMLRDNPDLQDKFDEYVLEIQEGKPETNDFNNNLEKTKKEFEQQYYSDPKFVFDDISAVTEFIAKKGSKSFICCGLGGVGKTYSITKKLEDMFGDAGDTGDWYYHSGMKITPFTIYKTLFQERYGIVVFDEADDILTNPDIVVQLKPVLDTSGKNTMEYAHGTMSMVGKSEGEIKAYSAEVDQKIADGYYLGINNKGSSVQAPSKFYFEGQIIFISNMPAKKIDQAIMSRSIYIDVQLCARDINNRIKTIMSHKYKDMSNDEMNEIMEALGQTLPSASTEPEVQYMTPEVARKLKPVTVRSMEIAIKMKQLGVPNWARLAALYV